ncbi:MAG: hypothetical protein KDI36_19515, partial [Pseudomonadales bacterium]|nr:hypothetical protein [Pseudomonadales bacterium]
MKRILWLVALLCLTACEPGPESPQPRKDISSAIPDRDDNEGWAVHIVDAPGGWLPQTGALHIRFSHEIGPELAGSADSEAKGLVTIEPAIPLSISLVASDTLQITPQQPFERGTEYTLTLFPQRLSSVSNALAPFQTRFRILHQDLGVEIGNLEVQAPSENYFLTGKLTTTDVASSADISRSVSAWLDSEEVPLSWYQTDPLTHEFSIADIKRKAKPGKLTIRWQGEPLGVDKAGEESVIIPGSGEFGLVGIRYARNAGNSLEISFSEPLSGQQDLAGMVSINGDSASRVTVDGNRLIAFPANPLSGDISISVAAGLQTARGIRSAQPFTGTIQVNSERPGVRLVDNTNLIPDGNNFRVPLEAINVDSVQLTLYQLPGSNLKQFLQQGSLTRQWIDSNTTRPLWRKTYPLPKIPR